MNKIIMTVIALVIIGSIAAYGLHLRNGQRAASLTQRLLVAQQQQESPEVVEALEASTTVAVPSATTT